MIAKESKTPWADYLIELFRHIDILKSGGNPGPPPLRPDGRKMGEPRGPVLSPGERLRRSVNEAMDDLGLGRIFE